MKKPTVEEILEAFDSEQHIMSKKELTYGHVNDTYLIHTNTEDYVLQRINHHVFKDVPGLVENKVSISQHLLSKLSHLSEHERKRRVLCFVKAKNSDLYYHKAGGNYWNLMIFVQESFTHDVVKNPQIAYEGGKLFGEFLNLTSDFESSRLTEVIPRFHDMFYRYEEYELALQSTSKERLQKAEKYLELVSNFKDEMHVIQNLRKSGEIPERVTHNDTKISNVLFDKNDTGLCVIDTDTVMPGIVHYDFGDAIRTVCNSATEDETDLSKVQFNIEYYKSYTKGFMEQAGESLTDLEIEYLPLAAKTMTFIMALRFLTDYLNHDKYYKIRYNEHNLDRSKNQFQLISSMEEQYSSMMIQQKAF